MSYSGEAAEQVVRISLEGAEVAAKITGKGAEKIAVMLYSALSDEKKTKGKTRLNNLLRSGKELKVFAVKDEELMTFCKEAKRYGVLYCALKDREQQNGTTDIMVRAEDASKVSRIFERYHLSSTDMASLRSEIQREKAERNEDLERMRASAGGYRSKEDIFLDALMSSPVKEKTHTANPTEAREDELHPSEPSSKASKAKRALKGEKTDEMPKPRRSVREELKEIRAALDGIKKSRAKSKEAVEQSVPENILKSEKER